MQVSAVPEEASSVLELHKVDSDVKLTKKIIPKQSQMKNFQELS